MPGVAGLDATAAAAKKSAPSPSTELVMGTIKLDMPNALESLDVAYVGAAVKSQLICRNRHQSKPLFHGLATLLLVIGTSRTT